MMTPKQVRALVPAQVDVSMARLPSSYNAAKSAIALCARVDECKDWADKAAALASYAKQANDETLLKISKRIRARAVRRAGELLKQIEPQQGGDRGGGRGNHKGGTSPMVSRKSAAADAGLSPDQAKQAIRVANVPDADFESQVEDARPATVTALADQGRAARAAPKRATSSTTRPAPDADQIFAQLMRWFNKADDPTRARFLAWARAEDQPGEMPIAEVVEQLRGALRARRIEDRDRGFVAGILKQSKTGRWLPTPGQEGRARRLVAELMAEPVIDHDDDGGGE